MAYLGHKIYLLDAEASPTANQGHSVEVDDGVALQAMGGLFRMSVPSALCQRSRRMRCVFADLP